jgi:hypothetical protein
MKNLLAFLIGASAVLFSFRLANAQDAKYECIAASTEGQTLRKDEKLLEARDQILMCARDVCPGIVRSHCARWLTEIQDQIPSIVVRAQDAAGADLTDARLTIDGKHAKLDGRPVELDPGNHALLVEVRGGARTEGKVLLVDGEKARRVVLHLPGEQTSGLDPAQPPPPSGPTATGPLLPQPAAARPTGVPTGAWILGGLGLAAVGVGVYFTIAAGDYLDQLKQPGVGCSPKCTDEQIAPGRNDAIVSYVGYGVGAAAIGGAILWAVLANSGGGSSASARLIFDVRPAAGGAIAGFTGSY